MYSITQKIKQTFPILLIELFVLSIVLIVLFHKDPGMFDFLPLDIILSFMIVFGFMIVSYVISMVIDFIIYLITHTMSSDTNIIYYITPLIPFIAYVVYRF